MIIRTGFPEYIEGIAIGPDIEFLKKNTDLCQLAEQFPVDINTAYRWKAVMNSSTFLRELRNFTKHFMLDGPDLETETLIFYNNKIKRIDPYYRKIIIDEVDNALYKAKDRPPVPGPRDFDDGAAVDDDDNFLKRLADLLKNCNSPCNYFKAYGDTIGTIFDISRNSNSNTTPIGDSDKVPPPTHIGLNIFNKIPSAIRDGWANMCARTKAVMDDIESNKPSTIKRDTSSYTNIANSYADLVSKNKKRMQDCFRLFDQNHRYNAYDPQQNLTAARLKYITVEGHRMSIAGQIPDYNRYTPYASAPEVLANKANKASDDNKDYPKPQFNRNLIDKGNGLKEVPAGAIRLTEYSTSEAVTAPGAIRDQGAKDNKLVAVDGYEPAALNESMCNQLGIPYDKSELGRTFTIINPESGKSHGYYYADRTSDDPNLIKGPTIDVLSAKVGATTNSVSDFGQTGRLSETTRPLQIQLGDKVKLVPAK